jgi:hypothetical protein
LTATCNPTSHLDGADAPSPRHLFTKLIIEPAHATVSYLDWSWWRRRQQHRAKTSHYQHQALHEP